MWHRKCYLNQTDRQHEPITDEILQNIKITIHRLSFSEPHNTHQKQFPEFL